jgi:DNA primase
MSTWVNFADIRQRVSLEDVLLRYYRLDNLKRDGNKLIGPCPIHQGTSPRSFHADLAKNLWHCFSKCHGGGNQLDLVVKKDDCSIRDAALRLLEFFLSEKKERSSSVLTHRKESGATSSPPRGTDSSLVVASSPSLRQGEERAANQPLKVQLELKGDHPHLLTERGLTLATTEHFGVGYCSRGILRGMIALKIHDEEGELVAYAGRRLRPVDIREFGKYKFPKGFRKELVLYNLDRAKAYQAEQGLILVEGFFSVLKLYEAGLLNVVAAMGSELSDEQARLLADAKDVTVLFDGNEAGYSGAARVKAKLAHLVPVRIVKLEEGSEPESYSPQALRWLINGMSRLDIEEITFSRRRERPTLPQSS